MPNVNKSYMNTGMLSSVIVGELNEQTVFATWVWNWTLT